jgi:glutamyl-tRNA synthetase
LADAHALLAGINDWSVTSIDSAIRAFADARGLKLGKVAQPLRVALTGRTVSPGVFEVMVLIGRDETLARLKDQSAS